MEKFFKALSIFQENGFFKLEDAPFTFNQINDLIKRARNLDEDVNYQIFLKDVELIPSTSSRSSKLTKPIITGAPTDEEYSGWRHQWDEEPKRFVPCEEDTLELAFLHALTPDPSWQSIHLEEVHFSDRRELGELFSYMLFKRLAHIKPEDSTLLNLTLDFSMAPGPLNELVTRSPRLLALRLRSPSVGSNFLKALLPSLYFHPSVFIVEFSNYHLNRDDYKAMHKLFDSNYHIEELKLENPSDPAIGEAHKMLFKRLNQKNDDRFRAEQLSQQRLLSMAEKAVVDGNGSLLDVLFKTPNSLLSLRTGEDMRLSKVCDALPGKVYGKYPSHMEKHWPNVGIDFNAPFGAGKTAGEHLLEKAFEVDNVKIMELLLEPGPIQLQKSKWLNTFLIKKLFQDKKALSLQAPIVGYLSQSLSNFSPWINQSLSHHVSIRSNLDDLKKHLDFYLKVLVDRTSWSPLRKRLLQVNSLLEERKKEWELDFQDLVEGTQAAGGQEVLYTGFRELDKRIEEIASRAMESKRGILKHSKLHVKAYNISKVILQQIRDYCDRVAQNQKEEIRKLQESNSKLQKSNSELKETNSRLQAYIEKNKKDHEDLEAKFNLQAEEVAELREMVHLLAANSSQPVTTTTDEAEEQV